MVYLITIFVLSSFIVVDFILDAISRKKRRLELQQKNPLRAPKEVKAGERITITIWNQNVLVDCLNNNPIDKKMFVRVWYLKEDNVTKWHQDKVFPYDDDVFKDFRTLNPFPQKSPPPKTSDLFNDRLKFLLEKERFEEAAVIRDAIEKIKEIKEKQEKQKIEHKR